MRKHIDYFYKCFDKKNETEIDRICNECFNEYGYNFDTNVKREMHYDELVSKTNYQDCRKKIDTKEK